MKEDLKIESGQRNRRILVIDDNAAIHADFRKILAGRDDQSGVLAKAEAELFGVPTTQPSSRPVFEIVSAYQGQEGVTRASEAAHSGCPFAMAFVDVRMPPGWDGIETTARLWDADPDLQIVICTAYSDYSWDEMIARLGTSDRMVILKKPFDAVEVLQLANALTEKWTLLQQVKLKFVDLAQMVAKRTHELQESNERFRMEVRERLRAEQVLRSIQEKLNHFLAKSPAVLYSLNIEGGKLIPAWVSDNFAKFTGGTVEDWYQQTPALEYVEASDRIFVRDRHAALLAQDSLSLQYRVRRLDGSLRWVRDDRQLLRDNECQPIEIIGCWTDITDQRLLEEELRQSQKLESVGLLAGGIAHDFSNLLMIIHCNVEMLLATEQFTDSTTGPLRDILASADRAANLTKQLLAFSRKQVMQMEDLDVNELASALTKLLARTLGEHIELKAECGSDLPALHADRGMVEQVIMNLAVNARDAMPKGGQLTLATSFHVFDETQQRNHLEARNGRFLCICVTDTGTGIAPDQLPHIFEPFFTSKEFGKGTGLGLATVYGIVKQHGGWIEVESRVGQGSVFKVFLPASSKQPISAIATVSAAPPFQGGHETILVVEDEPALRGLVRAALQRQGYRVFTAESGAEELQSWSHRLEQIDLLLTDLVMPDGVTGWELAKQLQTEKPQLKTIFMSGYNSEINGHDGLVDDDMCLLSKPFGPRILAAAVRNRLDGIQTGNEKVVA